ncbi:uncharacterized protein EV422DRAFT_267793 [Fimicolochytrium jonesii]|uniref:uncharacterized protein n=1 Tax=Fimicolochytrium jonesii TaxID=1396493 RepID=UPI0022FEC465|nr:uncharacterized protein EV422DRAFT_267793 [Fimicolochytrium jonesii]KAI8816981.1 hypothetical protein EV422DRAFT_267793 [Fimicolochytrium jonesii]
MAASSFAAAEADAGLTGDTPTGPMSKSGLQSLLMSLSVILVSEIGDKTFFIAAILAMKSPRFLIFSAAMSALGIMTVLSAVLGHIAPMLISKEYTQLGASVLFFVFGVKMVHDAWGMHGGEGKEELREVAAELDEKDSSHDLSVAEGGGDEGSDAGKPRIVSSAATGTYLGRLVSDLLGAMETAVKKVAHPVWIKAFVLTFLAEWGDRSQIATVALAGAEDFWWVTIGTLVGHAVCSTIAVVGGRMLAARISVKTITMAGGILFLIFGVFAFREATAGFNHEALLAKWRDRTATHSGSDSGSTGTS